MDVHGMAAPQKTMVIYKQYSLHDDVGTAQAGSLEVCALAQKFWWQCLHGASPCNCRQLHPNRHLFAFLPVPAALLLAGLAS
jgi:hypothetical protein